MKLFKVVLACATTAPVGASPVPTTAMELRRIRRDASSTEGETKQLLEKQQADQADIVDYLKKEIEKKTAENQALERKYILLREAKENEEIRLQHELEVEKQEGEATKEEARRSEKKVEAATQAAVSAIDDVAKVKEKEILTV